jgi:hypothetical protein
VSNHYYYYYYYPSTVVNRLRSELNRLIQEHDIERNVLVDFQSQLDTAEYVNESHCNAFLIIDHSHLLE